MSDAVIISIIGAIGTLAGLALTGYVNIRLGKIHKQINSRMDQLLESSRKEANAVGNKEGRSELKQEQKKK